MAFTWMVFGLTPHQNLLAQDTAPAPTAPASTTPASTTPASTTPAPTAQNAEPVELPENFRSVDELLEKTLTKPVFCGGEPSVEDLKGLAAKGIRTIVSVDGVRPKVEQARRLGIRYVHIPMGYDGISKSEGLKLAQVAKECDGPIYLHCHHGKHRAPAATAFMLRATDQTDVDGSTRILKEAGTSEQYAGLWKDVLSAQPISTKTEAPKLVEVASVAMLPAQMATMDRKADQLQRQLQLLVERSQTKNRSSNFDASQADIALSQELALLLVETFQESLRGSSEMTELGADEKADFEHRMQASLDRAKALHDQLRKIAGQSREPGAKRLSTETAEQLQAEFTTLKAECKSCHAEYRD